MAKIYNSKTPQKNNQMEPKEETVTFLLNYSKAMRVITLKDATHELLLN